MAVVGVYPLRSIWKGAVSFGLVNIPVRLFAATESHDFSFRLLHRPCHTPIRYARVCPSCQREVEHGEIVRGYERLQGQFVTLEDDDLAALPLRTEKSVEILDFVRLEEIDPIFFERTYYLEPGDGGGKAYALLRSAMQTTGRVALAKVALRHKESLAAIRIARAPEGEAAGQAAGILALETMYFPDEIRSATQLEAAFRPVQVNEREVAMASQLVESLAAPFDAARYRDEYRAALAQLIEQKAAGVPLAAPEAPQPGRVVDLLAALEESIRQAEDRRQWAAR